MTNVVTQGEKFPTNQLACFRAVGLAFLSLLVIACAVTQQLALKNFTLQDGIPTEDCRPIFEDSRGFIWFGTGEGVVAYDGTTFTLYGRGEGFDGDAKIGLEDVNGQMWFGGIVGLRRAKRLNLFPLNLSFEVVKNDSGLPFKEISSIVSSPSGSVLVLSQDQVYEYIGNIPHRVELDFQTSGGGHEFARTPDEASEFLADHLGGLRVDRKRNALWVCKGRQLYFCSNVSADKPIGRLVLHPVFNLVTPTPDWINEYTEDAAGNIWMLSYSGHVYYMDTAGRSERLDDATHIIAGPTNIVAGSNDEVWIGGGQLYRASIDSASNPAAGKVHLQSFPTGNFQRMGQGINVLFRDSRDNIWFHKSYAGPGRINFGGFTKYAAADFGLQYLNTASVTSDGGIYLSGDRALCIKFGPGDPGDPAFRPILSTKKFDERDFGGMTYTWNKDTDIVLGSSKEIGMLIESPGRPATLNRIRPLNADGSSPSYLSIAQPTLCALRDRNGRLFFSVNLFGVVECDLHGTGCTILRTFSTAEGLGFRSTRAMTQANDGSLWFGGFFEGLSRLQGDSVRNYTQEDGLTDNGIRVLHESRDGTLWIGTRHGGMCVYRNGRFFEYPTYAALRSNTVWSLAEDSSGVMWVGTEQGLASFRPDPEYKAEPDVHHYDEREGIPAERIVSLAVDGSFLYCGLNSGVYVIDRSALLNEPAPSFLYLKSIAVNGIDVSSRSSLDFSPEENTLTIGYGVANQTASGSSLYRYKLAGLMTDWSPPTQQTEITFARLRPGSYAITIESLPVRMRHEVGRDSTRNPNVSVQFTVGAPYWQTPWFASCVIAALIGTGFGYSRYRVRVRAKDERIRAEENERVRKKVAADFHDEFGHRLTRISLFSEILKTKAAAPELTEYIEKIRSNAQSTYSGVRDFLWTLDPQYDSLYDLAIRLKSFGVELFDKTSISFRCAPIEPALRDVRLSLDWRRHLTLIFQEAMTNALKHSACATVSLDVRADNGSVTVSLHDDGLGIPANTAGSGSGLRNMTNRAEELHGSLSVLRQNTPGGTQVMFSGRIP